MAKAKNGRKSRKVKKSRNRVLYLIAALLGAIFIFTAGTMAITVSNEIDEGEPPERLEEPHLNVDEVFFIKERTFTRTNGDDVEEEFVEIETTVYLTNDGLADAKDVEIHAYPRAGSYNLAASKTEEQVGTIATQKTAVVDFIVTIPKGDKHDVELMILEDGKLILSGSGSVKIEASQSIAEKFNTRVVSGTQNDTDYDGMLDSWERFYGLNPNDPKDADDDEDNDGYTNLEEYMSGTDPGPAKSKEEGDGDDNSMILGSVIFVFIFIIVIIAIIGGVFTNKFTKSQNNLNYDKPSNKVDSSTAASRHSNQQTNQSMYWRCPSCGGWLSNGTCISCGGKYAITPVVNSPSGSSTNISGHEKKQ
jgi:hypothetical protein